MEGLIYSMLSVSCPTSFTFSFSPFLPFFRPINFYRSPFPLLDFQVYTVFFYGGSCL